MNVIVLVSNILGGVCVIIGTFLLPMAVWFLRPGIKNKDKVSLVIAVLIIVFAIGSFIGAYYLFTQGIMQMAVLPGINFRNLQTF